MNDDPYFISAVGTPLTESDSLHRDGLAAHLADQWRHGIDGVLVAGTMGAMQLLTDQTYQDLVRQSVELARGNGELLVGAGDASFARTRARIEFLNGFELDGVVVLAPYFVRFSQEELIDYYRALADVSRAPLYLYDLPQRTSKIELATVLTLAKHPNIRGAKCSDEPGYARQLMDALAPSFRIVIAQPTLVDAFLRFGMTEHLDGMYAMAPQWASAIGEAAKHQDWPAAARYQKLLNGLLRVVGASGAFQAMTALLNARGIAGNYAPRPHRLLSDAKRDALLAEPIVRQLLSA